MLVGACKRAKYREEKSFIYISLEGSYTPEENEVGEKEAIVRLLNGLSQGGNCYLESHIGDPKDAFGQVLHYQRGLDKHIPPRKMFGFIEVAENWDSWQYHQIKLTDSDLFPSNMDDWFVLSMYFSDLTFGWDDFLREIGKWDQNVVEEMMSLDKMYASFLVVELDGGPDLRIKYTHRELAFAFLDELKNIGYLIVREI